MSETAAARAYASAAARLVRRWRERDFRSHDPYDGLSGRFPRDPERTPRAIRLAVVQLHKRSPVNLRGAFGIPRVRDAYAAGLFASAALRLSRSGAGPDLARTAGELRAWLEGARLRGGWAYPFDVQTRTFFYPRTTPNVVSTSFAATAFLDAAELESDARALDVAVGAARFCRDELLRRRRGRTWFAYLPGDDQLIHNANLLAARLCARAGRAAADPELLALAEEAVPATLRDQRPDGAFPYGDAERLRWVDGHHTGFVLECLADLRTAGVETADAVERGARFYARRLFAASGAPRQAPDRDHPVDAIAGAQGIEVFARLGNLREAERAARWMLANMRAPSGSFVFQRGRLHRKAVPYARWCDAPMASALTTLSVALGGA